MLNNSQCSYEEYTSAVTAYPFLEFSLLNCLSLGFTVLSLLLFQKHQVAEYRNNV